MNDAIAVLLELLGPLRSIQDEKNALQEILQRITLLGLHRGGFFTKGAFYGGTALRILYGLDRFSEDLDFCLDTPDPEFRLAPYFPAITDELERFGFTATLTEKNTGPEATIESAFVKQSTVNGLLAIGKAPRSLHKTELVKIRLEVDKLNPPGGEQCQKLVNLPIPFLVRTLTLPSLFAGKLHAILARAYLHRVKGRDYYDLAFFLARKTPLNIAYLEAKLRDSGHYDGAARLTKEAVVKKLQDKMKTIDFEKAKQDVIPFISVEKSHIVREWSCELFTALAEELQIERGV